MKNKLLKFTAVCFYFVFQMEYASGDSSIDLRNFIRVPSQENSLNRFLPDEAKDQVSFETQNRTKRFFGLTSGAYGNNLQLGLSFIVPFLNIPIGGGFTGTPYYNGDQSSYYGTSAAYGGSSGSPYNLLGLGGGSNVILPIVLAIGAVIIIPYLLNTFTGLQTSPYGRSDDMQEMLNNLWIQVENSLQDQNIDVGSCLQKAVCQRANRISKGAFKTEEMEETTLEKILDFLITNSFMSSLLKGTLIQEALVAGHHSETKCVPFANKCPYSWDSIHSKLVSFALEAYNMDISEENLVDA